jgi:nucleoside-diphosphate-sugar epimerase
MKNSEDVVNKDLELICSNLHNEFTHLAGKEILITGGAGFLGYYLIQSLLHWNRKTDVAQKIRVTVYDNFIRGIPPWLVSLEKDNEHLTLIKHDITNPLPQDVGNFEYIIHAASIASPIFYRKHPIETMDANVNGLRILLDYCLKKKEENRPVEGFLFFSSSEIYGDPTPENIPTPESYFGHVSCTGPRACYDESKRYAETLCVNFSRQHDLPVKVARPFNNYGPGLKISDRRVLPDFARDVFSGRDIVLLSDGSATRTFCYIADAISGYYKVLLKGRPGEAYNIGTEEPEISIADIAEKVVSLSKTHFNYKGNVVYKVSPDKDYLTHNPNRRCPVITKARSELGYAPGVSLDEGLTRTLFWYNDNRDAEDL